MVLDEVQEMSSPQFLKLLKSLWDTYRGLRLVFTGSYVGVLRRMLEPDEDSPLYGRSPRGSSSSPSAVTSREISSSGGLRRMSHEEALKATLREAAKIILEELDHFLIRRRRYLYTAALRALRHGASWSELRDELGVNDKVLRDVLLNLRGAGLIARKDGLYVIDDPIVRMAVTKLRSRGGSPSSQRTLRGTGLGLRGF